MNCRGFTALFSGIGEIIYSVKLWDVDMPARENLLYARYHRGRDFSIKLILLIPVIVCYLPAAFMAYTKSALLWLGSPVMGFYPWIMSPGYGDTTFWIWEFLATPVLFFTAAMALRLSSVRLAGVFATTLIVSSLVWIIRIVVVQG
jgi:hypothetical protein